MPTQPIALPRETPIPMPRNQDRRAGQPATELDELHAGELAVAIHAAGIPKNWRSLSPGQVKDLALSGLVRLGLAEIRRLDRMVRVANLACIDKERRHGRGVDVSAEEKPLRAVWKSQRTAQPLRTWLSASSFNEQSTSGPGASPRPHR